MHCKPGGGNMRLAGIFIGLLLAAAGWAAPAVPSIL